MFDIFWGFFIYLENILYNPTQKFGKFPEVLNKRPVLYVHGSKAWRIT